MLLRLLRVHTNIWSVEKTLNDVQTCHQEPIPTDPDADIAAFVNARICGPKGSPGTWTPSNFKRIATMHQRMACACKCAWQASLFRGCAWLIEVQYDGNKHVPRRQAWTYSHALILMSCDSLSCQLCCRSSKLDWEWSTTYRCFTKIYT